jgi:glycosyltransferase involved in cell wall biosynthesis
MRRVLRLLAGRELDPIEPTVDALSSDGLPTRSVFGRARAGTRRLAVAGLFSTRCGLQRGAILMVKDLRARGFDVHALDLSRSLGTPIDSSFPGAVELDRSDPLDATDLMVHVNPTQFMDALRELRKVVPASSNVIGCWVWELPVMPESWRCSVRHCDAIWVPSPFVAETLARQMPKSADRIRVVPYAVDRDPIPGRTAESRRAARQRLGYAEGDFVVGYSFAFHSNYTRKNPSAAVDAFRLAFAASDSAAKLLIRMHDAAACPQLRAELLARAGGDPRIRFADLPSDRLPIVDFYHAVDLYLAPFRSEGYGLHLVEAVQAGLPVVATGWGLSPEIVARPGVHVLDYRLVPVHDPQGFYEPGADAVWAEPDVAQAARYAREVRERSLACRGEVRANASRVPSGCVSR